MPSFTQVKTKLFSPVDALATTIFLRLFGLIVIYQVVSYNQYNFIDQGILAPKFLFSFDFFGFVKPLSEPLMKFMMLVILVSGILLVFNKFIKIAFAGFLVCFSYFFLLDKSYYNNHFYLFILIALIGLFYQERTDPLTGKKEIPYWFLLLLQIQIVIVYFYGGLAKINHDWLFRQEPMRSLLNATAKNSLLPDLNSSSFALYLLTYGGLLFDLCIGFMLWNKRSRKLAIILAIGFHLSNLILFNFGDSGEIGGFPAFMIFALLLFADPEFVRSKFSFLNKKVEPQKNFNGGISLHSFGHQQLTLTCLALYLGFQLLFPFRHLLYSGDTSWTAKASKFSWRMKINTKQPDIRFFARPNPTDSAREINVGNIINSEQRYHLSDEPAMIVQFAHHIGEELHERGFQHPAVYASAKISLNGRPFYPVIDSTINLLEVEHDPIKADKWILPLPADERR